MKTVAGLLGCSAALFGLLGGAAFADPDELMPCNVIIIKAPPAAGGNGMTKFVCHPSPGGSFALPSGAAAPAPGGGAGVSVNTAPPGTGTSLPVASSSCTALATGYKCSDAVAPVILIKTNVVKGVLKVDVPLLWGTPHPYPGTSDVAVRVTTFGPGFVDTKNYCASFPVATALKNLPAVFKAMNAPAPASCQ